MLGRDDGRPLVQAPMDSPLNSAHAFSRKADALTKRAKYEDAIACHRKAAECLLQAMSTATSSTLLESMSLQHKAYLSQIDKLHAKNELVEFMNGNGKAKATVSRSTQSDGLHNIDTTKQVTWDEDTIYQTLRENEDMMNRLFQRNSEKLDGCLSSNADRQSYTSSGDPENSCDYDKILQALKNKTDLNAHSCDSVSELIQINNKLSKAVCSLLQELGSTKAEKKQMEEKLGESQEILKQGSEGLKFSSLDLPPLEVSYPELAHTLNS
ncbi:unnamed protein product [Lymnaea stagnalis]|uniref:Nuclear receptor-binding factor 2 MIT domain-containing protein n=1 Tax=Lymnaea stagnalis TaxID=6523 RepID=A0AAV2H4Y6_LYMST